MLKLIAFLLIAGAAWGGIRDHLMVPFGTLPSRKEVKYPKPETVKELSERMDSMAAQLDSLKKELAKRDIQNATPAERSTTLPGFMPSIVDTCDERCWRRRVQPLDTKD